MLAFQIQTSTTWTQILFYLWANQILVGEPMLPYERHQLSSNDSSTGKPTDLEQLMQINQSQQRAAEDSKLIFNRDPCSLFGLINIPILLIRSILRQ